MHGAVLGEYRSIGGPDSVLGYPTSDEHGVTGTPGRANDFANGAVYFTVASGPHEVHGAILGAFRQAGGPAGILGFPTTDESGAGDGVGRYNDFANGVVYFTVASGAHEVHGAILGEYPAGRRPHRRARLPDHR